MGRPRKTPTPPPVPAATPGRVPCPFVVLADTNELIPTHNGFKFLDISSNADTGHAPFDVTVAPKTLSIGDYSAEFPTLAPWEQPTVMVERKSKADLFGSIKDRENFEWRLGRLNTETEFAVVVVEDDWRGIFDNPPAFTQYSPTSVHRTVQSWQQRFKNVHWSFYPDRDAAESATFWYLYRFYENLKNHKLDKDVKRANYEAYYQGGFAHKKKIPITDCPHPKKHAAHSVGDLRDYWVRGWLDHESISKGRPFESNENPPIQPEYVGSNIR